MEKLKLKHARVLGYSDGANILFWLAARRPELVGRFVCVGGNIHYSGCEASFQKELRRQKASKIKTDPRYAAYSPDGKAQYPVTFEKCKRLWLTEPKWKMSLVRKIKAAGLVLVGDRDMIRPEHSIEIFRNLRHGQLAIIPGASHSLLKEKPQIVNPLILDFLKSFAHR